MLSSRGTRAPAACSGSMIQQSTSTPGAGDAVNGSATATVRPAAVSSAVKSVSCVSAPADSTKSSGSDVGAMATKASTPSTASKPVINRPSSITGRHSAAPDAAVRHRWTLPRSSTRKSTSSSCQNGPRDDPCGAQFRSSDAVSTVSSPPSLGSTTTRPCHGPSSSGSDRIQASRVPSADQDGSE